MQATAFTNQSLGGKQVNHREIRSAADLLRYLSWLASPEAIPFIRRWFEGVDPPLSEAELGMFMDILREHLGVILVRLRQEPMEISPREVGEHSVVFWPDAVVAGHVERLGSYGRTAAERLRQASERAWEEFVGTGDPLTALDVWRSGGFFDPLVGTLFHDVFIPRANHEANRKCPAISLALLDVMREALLAKGRRLVRTSGEMTIQVGHRVVAQIRPVDGIPVPADIADFISDTRTVTGHRLVRWLVGEGYRREHDPLTQRDCRNLMVSSGFGGLARLLGASGDKAADQVRKILSVMQHAHLQLPHGEVGSLLTWELQRASPGRAGELRIKLGDALLPEYVVALPKGTASKRDARRLVPIPERLPPLVGHRAWFSAQALLQLDVLREMRLRAGEIEGGVRPWISVHRWLELAEAVELPGAARRLIFDAWTVGTDAEPPFLVRDEEEDNLSLGPEYEREAVLLEQAGRLVRRGSSSAAASRRRRQRLHG